MHETGSVPLLPPIFVILVVNLNPNIKHVASYLSSQIKLLILEVNIAATFNVANRGGGGIQNKIKFLTKYLL
jgi:hypothetical protein